MDTEDGRGDDTIRHTVVASAAAFLLVGGFAFFYWQHLEGPRDTVLSSDAGAWRARVFVAGVATFALAFLLAPFRSLRPVALGLLIGTASAAIAIAAGLMIDLLTSTS